MTRKKIVTKTIRPKTDARTQKQINAARHKRQAAELPAKMRRLLAQAERKRLAARQTKKQLAARRIMATEPRKYQPNVVPALGRIRQLLDSIYLTRLVLEFKVESTEPLIKKEVLIEFDLNNMPTSNPKNKAELHIQTFDGKSLVRLSRDSTILLASLLKEFRRGWPTTFPVLEVVRPNQA